MIFRYFLKLIVVAIASYFLAWLITCSYSIGVNPQLPELLRFPFNFTLQGVYFTLNSMLFHILTCLPILLLLIPWVRKRILIRRIVLILPILFPVYAIIYGLKMWYDNGVFISTFLFIILYPLFYSFAVIYLFSKSEISRSSQREELLDTN